MAYNPQNPNGQATMANSAPVVIASDQLLPVHLTQEDTFEQILTSSRYSQVEVDFSTTDPDSISTLTVTKTGTPNGGDASNLNGQAVFTSGTNTSGGVKAVTTSNVTYRPHSESYVAFSIIFPSGGLANSYQRIGLYDANNGFFIGYEGTSFSLTIRKGGSDTTIPRASWNMDTLTGGANSKYTSAGTPVAFDPTKDNLFRIRFGWLGAANVTFDIYSPDGVWLPFHIYRPSNVVTSPSINNPNLPITLDIQKTTAGATSLTMNTACWSAGSTSEHDKITATITDNSLASLTRSVITGEVSGGGGGSYKNVKATSSGALVTATTLDAGTASIGVLGANSGVDIGDVTINNAAGASAVNIQDGGNSITVDGTITANAGTGTMNVTVVSGATGGDSTFHLVSAATTNLTNIKASAGKVTGWYIYNSNASARKVAFHNTAGTPTAGASIHSTIIIPGLAAANVSFPDGIDFSTGIAISTVTDLTDAGTNPVGLNDLIINIYYK